MQQGKQAQAFEFTGSTGEYFKVWIVNLGLTLITLGIYSAWAKVRSKRYFYGNTWIDRSSFDYLASPIAILKGRLISVVVVALYLTSTHFYPLSAPFFALAFFLIMPWLVVRSLCFNARNTAYRHVTFDFNGPLGQAYLYFLVLPLLTLLTLGLAYPAVVAKQKRYFINHSYYGRSAFKLSVDTADFFWAYLKVILIIVTALMATFFLTLMFPHQAVLIGLVIYPAYLIAYTIIQANVTNLVVNHSTLEQHGFSSHLEASKLLWLYFSNSVAILLSLGLLIPWAMIRTARYRVECTALVTDQPLDHFVRAEQQNISATGEELSDLMDIEFGL